MLGRKCVPERDRVPSLQCYGYPLEQEHGLQLLVGYLSDSSSHFVDKLDCVLDPRSSSFNCYWRKFGSLPVLGTSPSCCLRLGLPPRCCCRCVGDVRVGVGVRTVTSYATGLLLVYGMIVAPSGLLPSERDSPTGSLTAAYCAFLTALHTMSFSCA